MGCLYTVPVNMPCVIPFFQIERANYLLNAFVECARKGETHEGRLIHHLLFNPSEDGGQWDMLTNLVEKYGVVPKVLFPEASAAQNSRRFGILLNNRVGQLVCCACTARFVLDLFVNHIVGFPMTGLKSLSLLM